MKRSRTGLWCVIVLSIGSVAVSRAQEQPAVAPASDAEQQQTPPAQQPPPQQPPPQQPAPAQEPRMQPSTGIRQAPPPLPKIPDVRQLGETGYWIGVTAWFPTQGPTFDKGHESGLTTPSRIRLQGKPKLAEGAEIGIAIGLHNALRITYDRAQASGNLTAPTELRLWNQQYDKDTYLSTNYRLDHFKISMDYLTWPYPVESRRFRLKTLWQVQYTAVRSIFNAPLLPLVDEAGNPFVNANGEFISYQTQGTRSFLTPSFGIGIADYVSRQVRIEANASGFAFPHRSTIWDADASANVRVGHFELRVGAKALHYKTSTKAEFYLKNTMGSAFVGLRWYSD